MSTTALHLRFVFFYVIAVMFLSPITAHADNDYRHAVPAFMTEYHTIDGTKGFYVALKLDIEKKWHTYWKNPGDSGLETTVTWENLPEGLTISEMIWLPPTREMMPPLTNYGYSDTAYHVFYVTPPKTIPDSGYVLKGKASWLVCKETCIPERANISLSIARGTSNIATSDQSEILLAVDAATLPTVSAAIEASDKEHIHVRFTFPDADNASDISTWSDIYFFPEAGALIEHAAPQQRVIEASSFVLTMQRGYGEIPTILKGILEITDSEGRVLHYRVGPQPVGLAAASDGIRRISMTTSANIAATMLRESDASPSLLVLLLFAFLGGIILNAMPCVFPVLSLKAITVSNKSGESPMALRLSGIGYTLGILSGFAVAAIVLIGLKSAGSSIGWGFQMQSPLFVSAMALLLFVVGLNLSGYLEIRRAFGGSSARADKEGIQGAYFTGLLAAAVATPCTAPFMATALGAALTLPPLSGGAIFLALGFGLAFPYLLLTFIPGFSRILPKPGAWMERLRHALAYPMFFSVVWLVWVLMQQVDIHSVSFILIAMVSTAAFMRLLQQPGWIKKPLLSFLILLFFTASAAPFFYIYSYATQSTAYETTATNAVTSISDTSVPYSADALQAVLDQDKKAFVYATAAWCITCKVNERIALNHDNVKQAFTDNDITVFRADWTNEDANITVFLERFGRNGVPLYVYYGDNKAQPTILPQLLTPSVVLDYISVTLDSTTR